MGLFGNEGFPLSVIVDRLVEVELGLGDVGTADDASSRLGLLRLGGLRSVNIHDILYRLRSALTASAAGASFLFKAPVYSSIDVSAFSRIESTTSTMLRQRISTSSASSRSGALSPQTSAADLRSVVESSRIRVVLESRSSPTLGLTARWNGRSSAETRLTDLTVATSAAWTLS